MSSPVLPSPVAVGAVSSAHVEPEPSVSHGSGLWLLYLAFGMAMTVLYYAFPEQHLATWTPIGLSSVAATVAGVIRYKPRQWAAWLLLAGANLSFIAGDSAYTVLVEVLHQDNPFPSIADILYLLTYPLFAAGIFLFIRGRSSTRDRACLIDALIITTGLGLLSWVYLIVPNFQAPGLTSVQQFISVAYPLGDVLVLAMLARLVSEGGIRIRSMQLLVLGTAGLLIADALYGLSQISGGWVDGGPVNLGWVTFYLAWGCAALHPSMARLGEIQPLRSLRMDRFRVVLLALVSLIAPAVLLAESVAGEGVHARTIALFSAALFLLVIARLWAILNVHQHQAFHDSLTGLPNRALFHDRAEHALARTSRLGTVVAMVMLDLDDFKFVNDTRGHGAGDELLLQVAGRLQSTFRVGTTVSRLGGDEFAVLIEDLTDPSQAENFAERALQPFATPFIVQGEDLTVRASVGLVVTGGRHGCLDLTELMRRADLALYAAKERGKGQITLYRHDLRSRMLERLTRRSDLERAMDTHEFILHFQPIVSVETGKIVGCEALVRWQHPRRGLLPSVAFLDLAEETGLIVDLGRWVLDQSCAQMRSWVDGGHTGLRVSVNVSARQLQEAGFVDDVLCTLLRHQLCPDQLVLELTESNFALDAPAISEQLRALRDAGVKIAIDDFGTGYSSLSYLQKFQFDILKIDKSFVDALGDGNVDGRALANAIISLGHSLRLTVIAEGIEHPRQQDELWTMGCSLGQGSLYASPMAPDRMTSLLSSSSQLGPRAETGQRDVVSQRLPAMRSVPSSTPAQP